MSKFYLTITPHTSNTPLAALAYIFALPTFLAVIFPLESTDTTVGSLLVHVIVLFVALLGLTVAVNCEVALTDNVKLLAFNTT